jgi:hypothetical protein
MLFTHYDAEERRLPVTVSSHKSDTFSGIDPKVHPFKEQLTPEALGEIFYTDHTCTLPRQTAFLIF